MKGFGANRRSHPCRLAIRHQRRARPALLGRCRRHCWATSSALCNVRGRETTGDRRQLPARARNHRRYRSTRRCRRSDRSDGPARPSFEDTVDGDRPRRHENVDPSRPRPANRSARRAGRIVRRACNTSPARKTTTSCSAAWPKIAGCESTNTAYSAVKPTGFRRQARPTRTAETTSPAAPKKKSTPRWTCPASRPKSAKPARNSPGPPPARCPELIEVDRPRRRLAHAHHRERRQSQPRGDDRGRNRARPEIHRHHRPLAASQHGQRPRCPSGSANNGQEIDDLNREFKGFTILKGIECDILEKGGMDLPDDVLAEADWVIASVHYGQQQPREQITDRILGGLENPHVSIIAASHRPPHRPPRAVCGRLGSGIRLPPDARQADGNQRQPAHGSIWTTSPAPRPSGTAFRSSSAAMPTAPAASTSSATASCKPAAAA